MIAKIIVEEKFEKDGGHWRLISLKAKRRRYSFFEDAEEAEWQMPLIEAKEGDEVEFYFVKGEYKGKPQWNIVGPDDPLVRSDRLLENIKERVELLEAQMGDIEELSAAVEELRGGKDE